MNHYRIESTNIMHAMSIRHLAEDFGFEFDESFGHVPDDPWTAMVFYNLYLCDEDAELLNFAFDGELTKIA